MLELLDIPPSKKEPKSVEGLEIIGSISDENLYLVEDHPDFNMKLVYVGDNPFTAVRLGSLATFRPYEEITLNVR